MRRLGVRFNIAAMVSILFVTISCTHPVKRVGKIEGVPVEAIVQQVLELPQLDGFFTSIKDEMYPLLLSEYLIGSDLELKLYGKKVAIVEEKDLKNAYIRFTSFECSSPTYCNIAFEFPFEGVTGGAGVIIEKKKLTLEKVEVSEH